MLPRASWQDKDRIYNINKLAHVSQRIRDFKPTESSDALLAPSGQTFLSPFGYFALLEGKPTLLTTNL